MSLERLARFCYRRRRVVLGLWVLSLVGFIAVSSVAAGPFSRNFSLPGTESTEAYELLQERFPARSGDTATVVVRADAGIDDPGVRADIERLLGDLRAQPHVSGIDSPYDPQRARVSPDRRIAQAEMQFDQRAGELDDAVLTHVLDATEAANRPGLQVEAAGAVEIAQEPEQGPAEGVGLLAAVVILFLTFGSLLAMGLPILTALFGIGIGLSLVGLCANFLNVPNFTPIMAAMIGIGVGIDYALFIVTRYRSSLHEGLEPEAATVVSITTAGRAVLFAGVTVVISMLGILLMGFRFVEGVAVGGAATVLVTMLASVTLLPALLGFVGRNIDRFTLRRLHKVDRADRQSFWFRWSRVVQRRPGVAALAALAVLVLMSLPLFSMNLGVSDAGTGPKTYTTRRAYDLTSQGFGPGFNGPLVLAAQTPDPARGTQVLNGLVESVRAAPGVAFVTPPRPNPEGDAAVIAVFPTSSPQSEETEQLVHRLRDEVVPAATEGSGVTVLVGGITAVFNDFAERIAERLPLLMGVVIGLSFLVLMVVFRSVLVPLKAAIMNLLSIGAAYGVIVAVFQWGWLKDVVGADKSGPIDAWAPMMLFAILFGLSMDYEVFLLSRVREEYERTGDNGLSVANGLAATARVITAAAAIMVTVFLTFGIGTPDRAVKLFGVGLATAIFVDATIVRMVLVPATMELLGDANWWLPRWLQRLLPKVKVEGTDAADAEREREPEPV